MLIDLPPPAADTSGDLSTRALQLAALGSETRLSLFRLLVVAGENGLNTGEISTHLNLAGSTLNHHLATLETAGLIAREREGRHIRCRVAWVVMHGLVDYLTENCCCEFHEDPIHD